MAKAKTAAPKAKPAPEKTAKAGKESDREMHQRIEREAAGN